MGSRVRRSDCRNPWPTYPWLKIREFQGFGDTSQEHWFVGSIRCSYLCGFWEQVSLSITYNGSLSSLTLEGFESELRGILLPASEEKQGFERAFARRIETWEKSSLYIISSFFFACILFIYATSTNYQNSSQVLDRCGQKPIPIRFLMSQSIFSMTVLSTFISGLHLKWPSFWLGQTELLWRGDEESTRKFKVKSWLN